MPNDDDSLLVAIFKEVAVIQGKRTPEGAWLDATPWHVQNALETAMRLIENARTGTSTFAKPAVTFETSRKA